MLSFVNSFTRCSNLVQIDDTYVNNDWYSNWRNVTKWQERSGAATSTPRLKHISFTQFTRRSTARNVWRVAVAGSYVLSRVNVDTPLGFLYHTLLECNPKSSKRQWFGNVCAGAVCIRARPRWARKSN